MIQYKELFFHGDQCNFLSLNNFISTTLPADWKYHIEQGSDITYYCYSYVGTKVNSATVFIFFSKELMCYRVGTIVPLQRDDLSIKEYNEIIDLFFADIVSNHVSNRFDITIEGPTSDKFDPSCYISDSALKMLQEFCVMANHSTGSSQYYDNQRWLNFICQTVVDNKTIRQDLLFKFLQDTNYWVNYPAIFGGSSAWDEDMAWQLSQEYEQAVKVLQHYNTKFYHKN